MKEQPAQRLLARLESREAHVAVMGLGYVGLGLAVALARAGLTVTGIEKDTDRAELARRGVAYTDIDPEHLREAVSSERFRVSTSPDPVAEADAVVVCVPTPLRKSGEPDISYVLGAIEELVARVREGTLVVLESTTYPGTTEELALPRLEARDLRVGEDVFLAFSPERIDPGNRRWRLDNTPKVVGGCTPACAEIAEALYGLVAGEVVRVSSPRAAEMCKLLENTSRAVNIALANEVALICEQLGVDAHEVISAAASKPFGFQAYWPGPGLGGHCIPVDPVFLTWKTRQHDLIPRLIETADEVNRWMPRHVALLTAEILEGSGGRVRGSRIGLVGVAYKENVGDVRESPALRVFDYLERMGAEIVYHDPHVPAMRSPEGRTVKSLPLEELYESCDCLVLLAGHEAFDLDEIVERAPLLVDTRNVTVGRERPGLLRLGCGRDRLQGEASAQSAEDVSRIA